VRSRLTATVVAAAMVLVASTAFADEPAANDLALEIRRIVDAVRAIRATPSLDQAERLRGEIEFTSRRQAFFLLYATLRHEWGSAVTPANLAAARPPDLARVEQARTDVQPGSTASASGTSSLVSKGSGPSYFAAAIENGALVREAGATTTTFQGNVVGVFDALSSKGYVTSYADDSRFARFMRRVSVAVTLRNGGPDDAVVIDEAETSGGGLGAAAREAIARADRRVEQYVIRTVVGRNRRDPRDEDNRDALRKLMDGPGQDLLKAFEDALEPLQISDEYEAWIGGAVAELRTVPLPRLEGTVVRQLNALCDIAARVDARFLAHAAVAQESYASFASARSAVLEAIERRPLFAVELVRQRRDAGASTLRFIGEMQKGRWDLTFNAAVTSEDDRPNGGPWYRDIQVAAEAGRPLGNRFRRGQPGNGMGDPVLTFGFLFERLTKSATVSFGGRDLAVPEGNLYIGQARITMPMGGGMKLPLSLSASNRTELLDEAQIRANVGFTFNFDAVASLFKP
jgi:hypothetical protein